MIQTFAVTKTEIYARRMDGFQVMATSDMTLYLMFSWQVEF